MNLFADLTPDPDAEVITPLLQRPGLRIERILSHGHTSPPGFWYDQAENEWVVVLRGRGVVEFKDGRTVELGPGDSLDIPAHTRHRVAFTDPAEVTLWLAVHDG
jgi:cupin 2 domain-containing protein